MTQFKTGFIATNDKGSATHTIDLPNTGITKLHQQTNLNQNSKLVKLSKKALTKFATAALVCTASTIAGSSLASTGPSSQFWLSSTLRHEDTQNSYISILNSNLTHTVFHDVRSRYISDDEQPNYTKAVVMALIRWMLAERNEKQGNDPHINVQKWLSMLIALHNSGTSNKMAILLAYVQNDIQQEVDKSNNNALERLDKAALAKQKKHDKEFENRQLFLQMTRLRQAQASMQQYAALNDKAFQLGFETFKRLKEIDENLNIPIHQREAFKAGIEKGKHNYDLAADRGLESSSNMNQTTSNSDNDLIEADKEVNDNEIKLNLSTVEN